MNITILTGRAVDIATSRIIQRDDGEHRKVANFRMAVPRPYKVNGKNPTDFYQVECWGTMADTAMKYITKGKSIAVNGFVYSKPSIGVDANGKPIAYANMIIRVNSLELGADALDVAIAKRQASQASQGFIESEGECELPGAPVAGVQPVAPVQQNPAPVATPAQPQFAPELLAAAAAYLQQQNAQQVQAQQIQQAQMDSEVPFNM